MNTPLLHNALILGMFGRKRPLYFGLALFALGSIGCSLAPNIKSLIVFRFIEGVGACAGMVIPRAIVRDLHTGPDATKLMSMLMLVFSVSPVAAGRQRDRLVCELAGDLLGRHRQHGARQRADGLVAEGSPARA